MRCWEEAGVEGVARYGGKCEWKMAKHTSGNMKRMITVVLMNYVAPIPSLKMANESILYP